MQLASYLSALLSLQSVVILGIGDDVFDIRWRHKFFIPGIASIPILIVYFVDFGVTQIVIPIPLRPYLGGLFDLGFLYYVYMAAVAIFPIPCHRCPPCDKRLLLSASFVPPSGHRLASFLLIYASPFHRCLHRAVVSQLVPLKSLRGRYILLLRRYGLRYCRHSGTLFKNPAFALHSPDLQLHLLCPTALPHCPLSTTPAATFQLSDRSDGSIYNRMAIPPKAHHWRGAQAPASIALAARHDKRSGRDH